VATTAWLVARTGEDLVPLQGGKQGRNQAGSPAAPTQNGTTAVQRMVDRAAPDTLAWTAAKPGQHEPAARLLGSGGAAL
jgi:hypothetical protein